MREPRGADSGHLSSASPAETASVACVFRARGGGWRQKRGHRFEQRGIWGKD
jgi:hypothetical protein